MTKIKICGLFREQDIDYVNEAKPDYAGFILHFPRSRRNLDICRAEILIERLRPEIRPVCVFADQTPETVIRTAGRLRPEVIQLHGHENNSYIAELKESTGLEVWKAFRVRGEGDLAAAEACSADVVLLDNGYGTGVPFDWSRAESFSRPFVLAGGLTPGNIQEAILRLRPMAVDVSSGVETCRIKDRGKIIDAVLYAHAGTSIEGYPSEAHLERKKQKP